MFIFLSVFFFNDTATTEIYTLSLHDALPICGLAWLTFLQATGLGGILADDMGLGKTVQLLALISSDRAGPTLLRSEEHTSELQSRQYLVCRLLLEKKKKDKYASHRHE